MRASQVEPSSVAAATRTWHLLGATLTRADSAWLQPFAHRPGRAWRVVPATYSRDGAARTSAKTWLHSFAHAGAAWLMATRNGAAPHGYITQFPPLAIAMGMTKRLLRDDAPLVAWYFNLATMYGGAKGSAARHAAAAVDAFVVHSRAEIDAYSRWLRMPASRFHFVPLQRPTERIEFDEDQDEPFIVALGSAGRDYGLLVEVASRLKFKTIIVAAPHAVAGIALPPNVEVRHDVPIAQCNELMQRARLCVVPVRNEQTASGQVALTTAMMYGRATVASRVLGTEDYTTHGRDAWLVEPRNATQLEQGIRDLWSDAPLRARLSSAARARVASELSDERTGAALDALLRNFESSLAKPSLRRVDFGLTQPQG
jgi:glycosyltransferase involved in cell wall biosynthesis